MTKTKFLQKKFYFVMIGIVLLGVIGFSLFQPKLSMQEVSYEQVTPASVPNSSPQSTSFTAKFEIYTNGTKRIFTQAMYHNRSDHVFIQNPDPSLIHVNKLGLTWNDFFQTLPFSVTKECLITGTKQKFCSNESQRLRFFLNDIETSNALDYEIKPDDFLKIVYGK